MPTSTNVTNLKINELTEAQYDTAVQGGVIGANELSFLTDAEAGQVIQVATLPTASADELGKIYQFVGTTDANYTNGYFYKCTGAGEPVVYSWSRVDVQPGSSLPSQTGNSGKFLTTDGTDANWGSSISHQFVVDYGGSEGDASTTAPAVIKIDRLGSLNCNYLRFENKQYPTKYCAIKANQDMALTIDSTGGSITFTGQNIIGTSSIWRKLSDTTAVLGQSGIPWANTYTSKVNNGASGAGDITVPTVAGSMAVQVSSMPTADSTLEGQIYQFVGTTDSTYTNGRFYKCVSDGQATPTYSWEEVSMGGGSSYTAGTGIDITNGTISVTSPTLTNTATGNNSLSILGAATTQSGSVLIGMGAGKSNSCSTSVIVGSYAANAGNSTGSVYIGAYSGTTNNNQTVSGSVAIGTYAHTTVSNAIQISARITDATNSDANTFKVANANGNYEMMSADGTIPTDRFTTTPSADGTYYPTLTISSGTPTRSWGTISALQNTSNVSNALGIIGDAYGIQSTAVGSTSIAYKLYSTALGSAAKAYSENMVAVGKGAGGYEENANYSIAVGADAGIGSGAKGAIQLGKGTNSTAGTFAVGLTTNGTSWNQYEVVSADGTIPAARHASLPASDGTYVLKLVISGGVPTLSWVAE